MGVHNNAHVPKESWPNWIWFAIEFFIVLGISALIAQQITNSIQDLSPVDQNWVFFSIIMGIFIAWYIIIRGFILKKPILENRY